MEAGPELDALIEVEIMERPGAWHERVRINGKWIERRTWIPDYSSPEDPPKGRYAGFKPPLYSSYMHIAWVVVERLKESHTNIVIQFLGFTPNWRVEFGEASAYADTPAQAICHAALKAKGIEV